MEYIHKQMDECPGCSMESETEHYFDFSQVDGKEYSEKTIQCSSCGCTLISYAEATANVEVIAFQASRP